MFKNKPSLQSLILTLLGITTAIGFAKDQLAFPTAEGYGKYTVGGRGGKVIEVTNLNASGPGSFAEAVSAKGPRTVVFRVAGTIDADVTISNDHITIAGQTAPGDGITLKGRLGIRASEVIIRYIRVRAEASGDAFGGRYNDNIMIDHVSTSWSSDEVTADNWKGVFPQYTGKIPVDVDAIPGLKLDSPSEFMPINQQTAEEAYQAVLDHAGCSRPNRDIIDLRIIEEVRNGTAKYGDHGFINNPSVVGGWPALKSGTAPADFDHDGMPDDWETKYGFDAQSAPDSSKDNDKDGDGYTNLEEYLNGTNPVEG